MLRRRSHVFGWVAAVIAFAVAGCTSTGESPSSGDASAATAPSVNSRRAVKADHPAARGGQVAPFVTVQATPINRQRDAYVLLSGGGTPLSNNYSQYLQARALATFFERECPPERTWVFFGAGNRDGSVPVLADTRRELKRDGVLVESWLPGSLPRNRTATRESFLRALREEILPLVRDGGTLYLFIGDHGELVGSGEKRESAITLWQLKRSRRRSSSWTTDGSEILGVAELRDVIASGIGAGRVVFGMTQCHGGGFHEIGIAQEMVPPRTWFSGAPPDWAVGNPAGLRLRVAGYTATDQASPAAGCDADPDPERWAGYERFLPEALLGIDLMSGQPKHSRATSLAEAHEAATLVDQTIDKPRSTSEHFLEAWARMIETRLARTLLLSNEARNALVAFERAVNGREISHQDPALRERAAQFARFTERLAEQSPATKELLLNGTRQQLEQAVRARAARVQRGGGAGGNRRAAMSDVRRAWADTLRPAWKRAVLDGQVEGLAGAALEFEKRLLKLEDGGRDFLLPRGGNGEALRNEMYWSSGYAWPAETDTAKAEAVTRWGAERRGRIIEWAEASSHPQLREAAQKIGRGAVFVAEPPQPLSPKTAAERVLFYRRVLAAWELLITMNAQPALAELHTLIQLEQLPVRPPS